MSTTLQAGSPRRKIWIFAAAAALATGIGGYALTHRGAVSTPQIATRPDIRTVEKGQAGPVGDLSISAQAMKLAEIHVGPVERRLMREKIALSGVIATTGSGVAKITPRVSGRVVKVLVDSGEFVTAGQTMVLLESPELAQAQATYSQASARLAAAQKTLDQRRELARLGAYGKPGVESAQRASVDAEQAVRLAQSDLRSAEAAVSEAESEVGALEAQLTQAQTALRVAQSRFDRADALLKDRLISRQEWEQLAADRERAEADVSVAQSKLRQGKARVQTAEAARGAAESRLASARVKEKIEREALSREQSVYQGSYADRREMVDAEATVREAKLSQTAAAEQVRLAGGSPGRGTTVAVAAPIAGRVQERSVTLGETVDPEHSLFTVVNLDAIWAEMPVAPRDLAQIEVGQTVELVSETAPGTTFVGTVVSIGGAADSTTRAVPVRVALKNERGLLKPGTYVKGDLITRQSRESFVVPIGAIQDHTNRKTLYVELAPGEFEVRHVILGPEENGFVEVREGIKGGERLALSGTFYLKSEALKSQLSDGCCGGGE